ncbi:hypothetical protein HPB49_000614 [Dermacentor silvarum]|uniref:Uncharacterized protein n=1 Tax=Dermacentor silvarum TaxID=543639 RepID=A0ACB8DRV2_DERSI|nr:hypothetical protein HPB49_000614 [Dermacentor silvarum]
MRDSGPPKQFRMTAPGRIPPLWVARPTRRRMLWPPRYPPVFSLYFVPFQGGRPSEVTGAGGGPSVPARTDKILPLEWNGCTFDRYTPAATKGAAAAAAASWHMASPGEPSIPPPPFGRPRSFERYQGFSRSQSRRGKHQQVYPRRAPAPPWTPGPLPQDIPGPDPVAASSSPSSQWAPPSHRHREQNQTIPRKENKAPASHMRLPPFLAMGTKCRLRLRRLTCRATHPTPLRPGTRTPRQPPDYHPRSGRPSEPTRAAHWQHCRRVKRCPA